jgi:hypothetical protein
MRSFAMGWVCTLALGCGDAAERGGGAPAGDPDAGGLAGSGGDGASDAGTAAGGAAAGGAGSAGASGAGGSAGEPALGYGHILYLNFSGGRLDHQLLGDDATQNLTSLGQGPGPYLLPAFRHDRYFDAQTQSRTQVVDDIVSRVRDLYAPFDVQVVSRRPPVTPFTMIMVGEAFHDLGYGSPFNSQSCSLPFAPLAAGLAPADCNGKDPNNLGYVAPSCHKGFDPEQLRVKVARTIAHEAAHTFGLAHIDDPQSLMAGKSSGQWGAGNVIAGANDCNRITQDDVAVLKANLGTAQPRSPVPPASDISAPEVSYASPANGTTAPSDLVPCLDVQDPSGLRSVVLQVFIDDPQLFPDPVLIAQEGRSAPPFRFAGLALPNATLRFRMMVVDQWDNLREVTAQVTVDDAAAPLPDCTGTGAG